jgi:hypothetical protein
MKRAIWTHISDLWSFELHDLSLVRQAAQMGEGRHLCGSYSGRVTFDLSGSHQPQPRIECSSSHYSQKPVRDGHFPIKQSPDRTSEFAQAKAILRCQKQSRRTLSNISICPSVSYTQLAPHSCNWSKITWSQILDVFEHPLLGESMTDVNTC